MVESTVGSIEKDMNRRHYRILVPRGTREMFRDYPELRDYPEFKQTNLKPNDLMFVWFFRCTMSPFYEKPDEKKLDECIEMAYPSKQQQELKKDEYRNLRFPDNIKSAFKRMESFNGESRIEDYLYIKQVRANCKAILGKDVSLMTPEEEEKYTKTLPAAMKALLETTKFLESGGGGVVEVDENLNETAGWLTTFRGSIR